MASSVGNSNPSGSSLHGGEWGVPIFQHQQTISMDWTPEEQAILEEGLVKHASESNIIRYAKIAVELRSKTVRDVALRLRWMARQENSKRRKEDLHARRGKDKKEKFIYPSEQNCRLAMQPQQAAPSFTHELVSNCNGGDSISFNDVAASMQHLLQQNMWAFKQIAANLSSHQIHENIGLLSQVRENIFKILNNLNEMAPTMTEMPPLPKLNEELAYTILPLSLPLPMQ